MVEADRSAHIALGREMERKRSEGCVEALKEISKREQGVAYSTGYPATDNFNTINALQCCGGIARKALADPEATK